MIFTPEQDQYLQLAQTRAYYQGLREGVSLFAHWRNGVQYVGTTGKTLKQALNDIESAEQDVLTKYNKMKQL